MRSRPASCGSTSTDARRTSPHTQGGYKGSGIGKDMGRPGIEAYLRRKAIWVNYA